uniref:Uncharacterized protein n=1 Tax=Micrurus lemniscatus lemniscatus TaxID=129467 RepID=A0A2D4HVI7_MICLE
MVLNTLNFPSPPFWRLTSPRFYYCFLQLFKTFESGDLEYMGTHTNHNFLNHLRSACTARKQLGTVCKRLEKCSGTLMIWKEGLHIAPMCSKGAFSEDLIALLFLITVKHHTESGNTLS